MARQRWRREKHIARIRAWVQDPGNREFLCDEPRKLIHAYLDGQAVPVGAVPQRLKNLAWWYAAEAVVSAEERRTAEFERYLYQAHLCDWVSLAWLAHLADGVPAQQQMVLSANDAAFTLARAIAISRLDEAKGVFALMKSRLSSHFHDVGTTRLLPLVFGVCSEWLGDADPLVGTQGVGEPVYERLVSRWRWADAEAVAATMSDACDVHLARSREHTSKDTFEFWEQTTQVYPAELLMICKLRTLLGLPVPTVSHPLFDGHLAVVMDTAGVVADGLLTRIRARASELAPELAEHA